jgi:hypothetical protein
MGDIGHEIDLSLCQSVQSFNPGAGHIAQMPAFALRDVFDDIDENARRFAGF